MADIYNPASARFKEKIPGTLDLRGIVTVVVPVGGMTQLPRGAVLLNFATPADANPSVAFEPTQDGANPRLFTIPGTDSWVANSIRMYWNGQRLRTSLIVVSGTGNRTVTLDPTVAIDLGDFVEGEGRHA